MSTAASVSSSSFPVFTGDVNFCPACGALLPPLPSRGDVACLACRHVVPIAAFAAVETNYTVYFNRQEARTKRPKGQGDEGEEGPVVERDCPKCGHDKMSYAALQLRSADEGQTVFFTCLKCKFKESENS